MYLTNDDIKQLDMLKKIKPKERFLIMAGLIRGQVEAMKAGIRRDNPSLDNKGLKRCLKKRFRKIYLFMFIGNNWNF